MEEYGWERAAPSEVQEFLEQISLPQYGLTLVKFGYDDVSDFATLNEAALQKLHDRLASCQVPDRHIERIVEAMVQLRSPADAAPPCFSRKPKSLAELWSVRLPVLATR